MDFETIVKLDKWLTAYLILKALDFCSGFIKAYKVQGFKSSKLREGVKNFFLEIILIFVGGVLDQLLGLQVLMFSCKAMFIYKECISLIENAGECGITIPSIIKDKIQDLNPDNKKEE